MCWPRWHGRRPGTRIGARPAGPGGARELAAGAAEQAAANDAAAQYRAALAYSYVAEVAQEQRDKGGVKRAAEAGIRVGGAGGGSEAGRGGVSSSPRHAIRPDRSGQRAGGLELWKESSGIDRQGDRDDPKLAAAYVSRGVGNYYLPSAFGGGIDLAIRDFQKAIELNPKSDEAYLWLGLALRKSGRNAEARSAFSKSLELNPNRLWTKQQLEKVPRELIPA